MKSRLLLLRTSLLLLCILCLFAALGPASADALRVPRVISIVYDDSSSMESVTGMGNAGYADYAIKAFIALLDTSDIAYITLMSDPDVAHKLELTRGIAYALAQLDSLLTDSDLTPFRSVATATNALKNQAAPDDASIYWLAVFTDGSFQDGPSSLDNYFRDFLKQTMPNGTLPQVCYVAIGDNAIRSTTTMNGLTVYPSRGYIENSEGILTVMRDLADRISGRAKVSDAKITQNGKTVRFTVDTPCFSIAFLQQKDTQPWVSIIDQAGNDYSGDKISIVTTKNMETLSGWASKITSAEGDALPAGTYELTFSSPPQDLVIMTEPALLLDINITPSGSLETTGIAGSDYSVADIHGLLHLWNETTAVDPSLLPENTSYQLSVMQNGTVVKQTEDADMLLTNVDIMAATTLVSGTVELPSIGRITASKTITLPVYSLSLQQEDSGRYQLRDLVGNTQGVVAIVLRDGAPLDAQATESLAIDVDSALPCEVTRLSTGEFRIVPTLPKLMPLADYGDFEATLTLQNASGITTPQTFTWTVQDPAIAFATSLLGASSIVRTDLIDSMGILDSIASEDALTQTAQTQIVAKIQVMLDGIPLTAEQINEWGRISVTLAGEAAAHYGCAVKMLDNGTILCAPYAPVSEFLASPAMCWMGSWYLWHGQASIQCSADWCEDVAINFNIILEPWYLLLLHYISPLLILVLLLGYIFKRRFKRGASVRWISVTASGDSLVSGTEEWHAESLRQFNVWSLVPYACARTRAGGLMFYAGRDMFILTPQGALAQRSFLISQKQCISRSTFAVDTTNDSIRPIHIISEEGGSTQNCVLAENDVLVFTGGGKTGRAYIYDI